MYVYTLFLESDCQIKKILDRLALGGEFEKFTQDFNLIKSELHNSLYIRQYKQKQVKQLFNYYNNLDIVVKNQATNTLIKELKWQLDYIREYIFLNYYENEKFQSLLSFIVYAVDFLNVIINKNL